MHDQTTDATPLPLSQRLGAETSHLHREAERSGIMVPLLRGELGRSHYVRLLEALLLVYQPLEEALDHHQKHPAVAPIRMPELFRTSAIERDIESLREPASNAIPPLSALAYQDRLRGLRERSPHLLAAHAWVRYMGDLSGGQMLGRIVSRSIGEDSDAGVGTQFYRFPEHVDPAIWKALFRDALDGLPGGPEREDAIVEEAIDAFRRHSRMFLELSQDPQPG